MIFNGKEYSAKNKQTIANFNFPLWKNFLDVVFSKI